MSLQPCRSQPAITLVPEPPDLGPAVDALDERAFGPGRFAKSSERVREFADFAAELSFCAFEHERLMGTVRMWRVAVGETPVTFLGPLAVEEDDRKHGVGAMLVERACEAARAAGETAVVLVGDLPYFRRFGFEVAPGVEMPGPVDPNRVLAVRFIDVALAGMVRPR